MARKRYSFIVPQIKCPFCRKRIPKAFMALEGLIHEIMGFIEAGHLSGEPGELVEKERKAYESELKNLRKMKRELEDRIRKGFPVKGKSPAGLREEAIRRVRDECRRHDQNQRSCNRR